MMKQTDHLRRPDDRTRRLPEERKTVTTGELARGHGGGGGSGNASDHFFMRYNGRVKTPYQFLRGGGMQQVEYLAARQAIAQEREYWLPILQLWYDDMTDADDLEERQALYRQVRRLRQLLGMKRISAPDAGQQRRIKTRERVRRYRERQRLKEILKGLADAE
jgi:hypothetical protein